MTVGLSVEMRNKALDVYNGREEQLIIRRLQAKDATN